MARKKRSKKNPYWWGYMITRARQVQRWNALRRECLKAAKETCKACGKKSKELDADHIEPVVPVDQPFAGDFNTYFKRLFEGALQALCSSCHAAKTKKEAGERKASRDKKKLEVTEADLDAFAERFPGAKKFVADKDSSSEE